MSTIKDVATRAQVSVSTVSKAYNNYSEISEATRARIFQAAQALGYIPNKAAVQLSRGKFPNVGLIVHSLADETTQDEHTHRLLGGVHSRISENGHDLVLYTTKQIKRKNLNYVDFCRHHSLVGAIIHGLDRDDPYLEPLLSSPIPCVLIDNELESPSTAFVTTDNVQAAEDVINLLAAKGHRHICHILGTSVAAVTEQRKQGVLQAAHKNNLPAPVFIDGEFNEAIAYTSTQAMLRAHPQITAIFAASDLMALGASRAITESGHIPGGDIALIGFDGIKSLEYTRPAIATVYQDFHEMGRLAVDTLFRIAKEKKFTTKNYVPHKLIPRETV